MTENAPSRIDTLQEVLRTIDIPSCPAVLVQLRRLLGQDSANLLEIAQVASQDVGLSAALLKVVNSPLFGLSRKLDSLAQAVSLLGLSTVSSISAAVLLKHRLGGDGGHDLERFWDTCGRVAVICGKLAREIGGVPRDAAYTFGLFQNAGTAVLMKRFPEYGQTLSLAADEPVRPITEIEDRLHRTNHAVIGYLLTRSWGLSEQISSAVLVHHDFSIFRPDADARAAASRRLVAIGTLATRFVNEYLRVPEENDWSRGGKAVVDYLEMTTTELLDLREACFEELELG